MKRIIAQQMLAMMRERSIDKITVKALIEACDISRQTFYYHFRDIMDVLEWILSQSMERMLQRSLKSGSPQEAMEIFIRETEENKDLIRNSFRSFCTQLLCGRVTCRCIGIGVRSFRSNSGMQRQYA